MTNLDSEPQPMEFSIQVRSEDGTIIFSRFACADVPQVASWRDEVVLHHVRGMIDSAIATRECHKPRKGEADA